MTNPNIPDPPDYKRVANALSSGEDLKNAGLKLPNALAKGAILKNPQALKSRDLIIGMICYQAAKDGESVQTLVDDAFGLVSEVVDQIDDSKLTVDQDQFLEAFGTHQRNMGLALGTGAGKTLTYLRAAEKTLTENPDKKVIICTPVRNLITQIKLKGIDRFESLKACRKNAQVFNDKSRSKKIEGRLLVMTPQKLESLLKAGTLDPHEINLVVFDEGGIGTQAETGNYGSFKSYQAMTKAEAKPRIILADGTPMNLGFLNESFDIEDRDWHYGSHLYETHREQHTRSFNLEESPKLQTRIEAINTMIQKAWEKLFAQAHEHHLPRNIIQDLDQLLQNSETRSPLPTEVSEANVSRVIELWTKGTHGQTRKSMKKRIVLTHLMAFYECLRVRNLLLEIGHEEALERIKQSFTEYLHNVKGQTSISASGAYNNTAISMGIPIGSPLKPANKDRSKNTLTNIFEGTDLASFGKQLNEDLHLSDELHPKMQQLLNEISQTNSGDVIQVISPTLSSAQQIENFLNHKGIRCSKLTGESRNNYQSHFNNYAIRQAEQRKVKVLITTSVAERGIDLPAIKKVIAFNPMKNGGSALQAEGRLREGGTFITLISPGREQGMQAKVKRQISEFETQKKQAMDRAGTKPFDSSAHLKPENRFPGTTVADLNKFNELDLPVNGRYKVISVNGPTLQKGGTVDYGKQRRKKKLEDYLEVTLVLTDETGETIESRLIYPSDIMSQSLTPIIEAFKDQWVYLNGKVTKGVRQRKTFIKLPVKVAEETALEKVIRVTE